MIDKGLERLAETARYFEADSEEVRLIKADLWITGRRWRLWRNSCKVADLLGNTSVPSVARRIPGG